MCDLARQGEEKRNMLIMKVQEKEIKSSLGFPWLNMIQPLFVPFSRSMVGQLKRTYKSL